MINHFLVIRHLYPNVVRLIDSTAYDADGNEVVYDDEAVQSYIDSQAYVTKRLTEYPSIGDQLDALFHAGVFPEAMAAEIQAIKNKYPKS